MVLEFAPQGALDRILASYKRAGVRLNAYVIQKCIVQVWTVMFKHKVAQTQSQNTNILAIEVMFRECNSAPDLNIFWTAGILDNRWF